MAEEFLEEQIKRIREMAEQVSRVRPLYDIYDVRNHSSERNGPARDRQPRPRRQEARDTSRRRGR